MNAPDFNALLDDLCGVIRRWQPEQIPEARARVVAEYERVLAERNGLSGCNELLTNDNDRLEAELAAERQRAEGLLDGLENCRLYATRYRNLPWAQTVLQLCKNAGVTGSPLRAALEPKPIDRCPGCGDEQCVGGCCR